MGKWYKKSFWRNLVDMHIPDWHEDFLADFSPGQYAANMRLAKVDAALLYSGNCLGICFWPTKAGHMHAGLEGADIVGPTLDLLQESKINTLVYFNIWSRWAFDNNPDWRLVRQNGSHTTENPDGSPSRFGQCCLNSVGYQEYVKSQIKDLADSYSFSGAWLDMLGWFGTVCYCADCRRRYHAETGREIPTVLDWYDPDWVSFQRKREQWMLEFAMMVRETLIAVKPGISVVFNCASWRSGWAGGATQAFLDQSDYLAGDFYGNSLMYSTFCKFLNNASNNRPIEFMTSFCVTLSEHTTRKTPEELEFSACGAFAHNGAFVFIDAINPDGTMDNRRYQQMGDLHDKLEKYLAELAPASSLMRDVSFLFNFESFINPYFNGTPLADLASGKAPPQIAGSPVEKMVNIAKMAIANQLAYDLTCLKQLKEAIQNSQLIVVPNQHVMLEAELVLLEDFVAQGGSLLITAFSGLIDQSGNKLPDFAHASLSGVHYAGKTREDITYLQPLLEAEARFPAYDSKNPVAIPDHAAFVTLDPDVQVLAKLTVPWSHSQEINHFGSAIANPPGVETDYPAVTLREYKKGKVMYICAALEEARYAAQHKVFASLITSMLAGPQLILSNAPEWLELLLYDDQAKNRYLLYTLKATEVYFSGAARDVNICARLAGEIKQIRNVTTGEMVKWQKDGEYVCWTTDYIKDFCLFVIEY